MFKSETTNDLVTNQEWTAGAIAGSCPGVPTAIFHVCTWVFLSATTGAIVGKSESPSVDMGAGTAVYLA